MLNKKEFEFIRRELKEFDKNRERTISISREIIKLSKQIIYSIHRNDLKTAEIGVKQINSKISLLDKNKNYDTGISDVAFQEFVEAIVFYEVVKNKRFPALKELRVTPETYLSGLADLTGELGRKAVHDAIAGNFDSVSKIKELVEDIHGEFLKFDLRNGELRKKSDSIKWNLNKLEDLVFSLKVGSRK
ncbi:hypothetical protein J4216_05730 [Candidatus Woesearchaeota archaeon]|nr:hypothetical protein [Candidatus Woesearchaeota archaeon]